MSRRLPLNTQLRLARRPTGLPGPECWTVTGEPAGDPSAGEVLVEVAYLSVDPGLRGWIGEGGSYVDAVPIGAVMRAFGTGRVIRSAASAVPVGAIVTGLLGVQELALMAADALTIHHEASDLPRLLGALGISGITAYLGVDALQVERGETVLVSGAAGSVGSLAGQLARLRGGRVIGIAGGPAKCAWLVDELGFDAAIDHRVGDVGPAIDRFAPDGVDACFDNVGGGILDEVLGRVAVGARVLLSGTVSQWGSADWAGLRNHRMLLVRRARMQGFLVFDHAARYQEARAALGGLLDTGALLAHEEIVPGGVRAFPDALLGLFTGDHRGKLLVEVAGG